MANADLPGGLEQQAAPESVETEVRATDDGHPESDEATPLAIEVTWSPAARRVLQSTLSLAAGATVGHAVRACAWAEVQAAIGEEAQGLSLAVWGQACDASRELRDGDRVEILRGLEIDPMDARRVRYEADGGEQALRRKRRAKQPLKARGAPTSRSSG
ncbi:MAG TPA: RnfH family protein [Burkholderiaceae bacterium]|jgi:hypothetical protein|nr:RnfH family protein [Burkholderiaceae bacterium]